MCIAVDGDDAGEGWAVAQLSTADAVCVGPRLRQLVLRIPCGSFICCPDIVCQLDLLIVCNSMQWIKAEFPLSCSRGLHRGWRTLKGGAFEGAWAQLLLQRLRGQQDGSRRMGCWW